MDTFSVSYSCLQVETALAIFEAVLEASRNPEDRTAVWLGDNGANALRQACMGLAEPFEAVWCGLSLDRRYIMSWDWEFIPSLLQLVEWPRGGEWPVVPPQADLVAAAEALMATLEASSSAARLSSKLYPVKA